MTRHDPPVNPKRAVIATLLPCKSCGYNLRGVRLDSACPECGLAVSSTVNDAIDPQTSDLPPLRRPLAVGNALVVLMLCLLTGAAAMLVPRVLAMLEESLRPGAASEVSSWWSLVTAAAALAGLYPGFIFLTPLKDERDPRVHRDVRFIALGLFVVAIIAGVQWYLERFAMLSGPSLLTTLLRIGLAAGAILAFAGTGGILHEIGRRSRTWRESHAGRQSMRAMNAAAAALVLASIISHMASSARMQSVRYAADFVVVSCALMILIGLAYLVLNAMWIRAAIRQPPPRLKDLVRIEVDTSYEGGSRE